MKQLPPIFKLGNNVKDNNQKYYYGKYGKVDNKINIKQNNIKEESKDKTMTIEEKINKIFRTKGYAFNIPVTITFSNRTVDTYLALRKNDSIITLDNEVIPISTITSLAVKRGCREIK